LRDPLYSSAAGMVFSRFVYGICLYGFAFLSSKCFPRDNACRAIYVASFFL